MRAKGGWGGGREGLGDGPIRPALAGASYVAAIVVVVEIPLLEKKKGKNLEHINRERGQ